MSKRKALVINIGWEQEPLVNSLFEHGYEVYAVHYNDQYDRSFSFKEVFISELRDLSKILAFAKRIQPDIVISDQCDYSHFAQAVISEALSLPGPTIKQAQVSSNKYIQRSISKETGIRIPDFKLAQCIDDVKSFIAQVGLPVILKPVDNRGSFGVVKIESENEILSAYITSLCNSHSRLILAEKFIEGFEITVDGYCFNKVPTSLSLAKKGKGDPKVQVSLDIKYPGELPVDLYAKAMRNNEEVTSKLGYTFGMTHSEYIVHPSGDIYLVESANRGGGVFTSEIIVPNVSGIDILHAYINDVSGNTLFPFPGKIENNDVILKFFSFKPGKIKSIKGIEEVMSDKDVLKFRLSVKDGDIIHPIENDANRHGFIIAKSNDSVRQKAQSLINKIEVIYES